MQKIAFGKRCLGNYPYKNCIMVENKELQNRIMKRVRHVYYLRRVFNPFMFKVYALSLAILGAMSLVSVKNIVANMPSFLEVGNMYHFTSSAIINTELSVQLVLSVIVVVIVLFIRDAIKNFTYHTQLATE